MQMPNVRIADLNTARLLANTASALARAGLTADNLLQHEVSVPKAIMAALALLLSAAPNRSMRSTGRCVIRGLLHCFGDPGPTPAHWREAQTARTQALDLALVLIALSLGKIFGWANQQNGRLVHNILPTRGYERLQVGASSTTELIWHTEDAFHPRRAEMLLLACMRNPDEVGVKVASIRRAKLAQNDRRLLAQPAISIMPDDSYTDGKRAIQPFLTASSNSSIGMATLWPAPDGPCLRYDPAYSQPMTPAPDFRRAYATLGRALNACAETVPISRGDILIIDNDIVVHGRASFCPHYDGTDRWLKRVLIRLPRRRPGLERLEGGYGQTLIEPQRTLKVTDEAR